jgi:hypothetical protein
MIPPVGFVAAYQSRCFSWPPWFFLLFNFAPMLLFKPQFQACKRPKLVSPEYSISCITCKKYRPKPYGEEFRVIRKGQKKTVPPPHISRRVEVLYSVQTTSNTFNISNSYRRGEQHLFTGVPSKLDAGGELSQLANQLKNPWKSVRLANTLGRNL